MQIPHYDDLCWADLKWRTRTLRAIRRNNPYISHDDLASMAGVTTPVIRQWWSAYEDKVIPEIRLRVLLHEIARYDAVV